MGLNTANLISHSALFVTLGIVKITAKKAAELTLFA